MKAVFFDVTGMCLFYKRLDRRTFRVPEGLVAGATSILIEERELEETAPPATRSRVHGGFVESRVDSAAARPYSMRANVDRGHHGHVVDGERGGPARRERMGHEESCKLLWKRGGMRRLVIARVKYRAVDAQGEAQIPRRRYYGPFRQALAALGRPRPREGRHP